jgi:D-inositol-3-phosphate glycosyltransferase
MSLRRLAVLSVHTSPLAQPGAGDGGGMNVYVRALASALARAGVECDVLTRRDHPGQPAVVDIEPGFRVVHLAAGPPEPVPKHELVDLIDPLAKATLDHMTTEDVCYDALHANYWISGAIGHQLKHELDHRRRRRSTRWPVKPKPGWTTTRGHRPGHQESSSAPT